MFNTQACLYHVHPRLVLDKNFPLPNLLKKLKSKQFPLTNNNLRTRQGHKDFSLRKTTQNTKNLLPKYREIFSKFSRTSLGRTEQGQKFRAYQNFLLKIWSLWLNQRTFSCFFVILLRKHKIFSSRDKSFSSF